MPSDDLRALRDRLGAWYGTDFDLDDADLQAVADKAQAKERLIGGSWIHYAAKDLKLAFDGPNLNHT